MKPEPPVMRTGLVPTTAGAQSFVISKTDRTGSTPPFRNSRPSNLCRPVGVVHTKMVMALVKMRAFLNDHVIGKIAEAIPIDTRDRRLDCRRERRDLRCRIVTPGGIACLGHPEFRRRIELRD